MEMENWTVSDFYPKNHEETLWEECNRITYQFLYFKSSNDIYPVLWWLCPVQTGSTLELQQSIISVIEYSIDSYYYYYDD